ncbi:hypothetical protein SAMN04488698_1133 [Candidatus Frackibacter sp. WG12]|uniref:hypothetical protein n=1 Tax=unclassified Candidatus Frackibacter TaxID=2648818 RepID=UPI00087E99C1|nr:MULTISPECIES: hypothetical protein [unclassified Candidatus Frackibacter]SDC56396.1 hypothetical protein SAMN04515661_1143 [Candidatus Frackibacter sp. WG11]SEM70728.1 hypothetical protein SAMN04488698_1133 [Candidatus Frackibacter sp. WG12]
MKNLIAKKALINISIFFMILATAFLSLGIIIFLNKNSFQPTILSFLGTIVCLLFALLAKPTKN